MLACSCGCTRRVKAVLQKRYVVAHILSFSLMKKIILIRIILKAQLPSLPAHFDGSESTDHMFDELLQKVQVAYDHCPAYITRPLDAKPSFERYVCLRFVYFYTLMYACNTGSISYLVSRRELLSALLMNPICLAQLLSSLVASSRATFSLKLM